MCERSEGREGRVTFEADALDHLGGLEHHVVPAQAVLPVALDGRRLVARGSFFRISSSTSSVSFFFIRFPSLSSDAAPSAADAHCRIAERCGERTSRRAPPGPSNASDTDKKNTTTHRSTGIIFAAFDAVRFASRCIVQLRCAMGRAVTCLATKTVPYRARNSVLVTSSFEPLNFH